MASLEQRLVAGLEAQDWRETSSRSPYWRRFAKFGRGAMYVLSSSEPRPIGVPCMAAPCTVNGLAFSDITETTPEVAVVGPTYDQVLLAGDKWLKAQDIDTEALLIELLYAGDDAASKKKEDDDD